MESVFAKGYNNLEGMPHSYSRAETSRSYEEEILRPLALDENSQVLDLACGGGHEATAIKQMFGSKVIESDLNDLAFAANPDRRRNFVVADINSLPFPEESFDLIHFKDGFVHLQQKSEFFASAKKLLKQKGRMILITDCAEPRQKEASRKFFVISQGGDSSRYFFEDLEDYKNQVRNVVAYRKDMGAKNITVSLPYFSSTQLEIEKMAAAQGLNKVAGVVPDFWQPAVNEKNWGHFTRHAFLFEKI